MAAVLSGETDVERKILSGGHGEGFPLQAVENPLIITAPRISVATVKVEHFPDTLPFPLAEAMASQHGVLINFRPLGHGDVVGLPHPFPGGETPY